MSNAFALETLSHCPLCGASSGLRQLLEASDYESHTGDYPIIVCSTCSLAFTNPRPTEASIPALYDSRSTSDFAPGSTSSLTQRLRAWVIDRYVLHRMPDKGGEAINVLDFGCGDGALAAGVIRYASRHELPISLTAVDFHSAPPAMLANCGARAKYLDYWQWREDGAGYDAIFLRHVLEHHPEPTRLLEELGKALNPGGIIHIEVPNRRSIWASVFRRYFFAYYVPRHLLHFDESSLACTVEKGGLRVVELQRGHTPVIGRSLGYAMSRNIDNLGILGLISYPTQILLDLIFGRSTTLRIAVRQ